jgi:hypothetical protein
MKKELSDRIDKAIEAQRNAADVAAESKDQRSKAEQQFVRDFCRVRDQTIHPAMVEIADKLHAAGHRFTIEAKEEGSRGSNSPAGLTLTIFNQPRQRGVEEPKFSVVCDKTNERAVFYEGEISMLSGIVGGAGEAKLSDVSADLVHEKLVPWVEKILRDRTPS